ncbi:hypothetical protein [Streptomyces albus]|uniref:hypothetical protein n=1 Tax=Streptomyces albus TaxID=1888 RepID=UPI0024E152B8|nr:hypothetical protein [Streptomyces albus]
MDGSTCPDGTLPAAYFPANAWPDPQRVPGFREAVEGWFARAGALARRLTGVFAYALGLPEGFFRPYNPTAPSTSCG